jgi:hypothetical protein
MTTSSEGSVELEVKVATTPRPSHHKSRRRKKIAARTLLILGLVIGVLATSDFVYNAQRRADCYPAEIMVEGITTFAPVRKGCSGEVIRRDELMRWDAAAVLLAAACVITATVISRKIKRHRR